jgi:hypothetical protein
MLFYYIRIYWLRELYSFYTRCALSDNEIVLILPFLETADTVRRMLSGDSANIDVRKYEKEQSLLIIDSLKGYFGLQGGLMPFLIQTADFAKKSEKRILSVLSDMGSFFYYDKKDDLLQYEMAFAF